MSKAEQAELDPKYLEGLVFNTTEERKVKEDGKDVKRVFPIQVKATLDHVTAFKEVGDTVVICLADGSKHRVSKNGKPEKKK
jgi:hypothetical protein